jgi:uncharacterized membrane protein YfcA
VTATDSTAPVTPWPGPLRWAGLLTLGFATDFLDTLGVGSFATTSTALKLGKLAADENIPGTLNVGHALPTILEAALYITVIRVERLTLVSMIVAGALGSWLGAGIVVGWPRRTIQRALGWALLATAAFIALRQAGLFPPGGDALGLSGGLLVVGVLANALFGALCTLGIGNYAPSMALISLLGMNPTAAFPIMMGSAAVFLPVGGVRFLKARRYDRPAVIGLALGGIPGVLVAALIVKSLPLGVVRWLVVGVLIYTAALMWISASRSPAAASTIAAPEAEAA